MVSSSINNFTLLRIFCGIIVIIGVIFGLYLLIFNTSSIVVVQWNTESEIDTAGFNLYRSAFIVGPFEKINQELIPASSDAFTGSSYSYNDEDVVAGQTYFYQLEDVDRTGNTSIHGPIEVIAGRENTWWSGFSALLILIGAAGLIYSFRKPH